MPKDQISALQKQFQPSGKKVTSGSNGADVQLPKVDEATQNALVKQLVEALLQYLLQILK